MGKLAIYARLKPMYDAVGRADYISNPDRQENLLAVAGKTDPEFWKRLAVDSQTAWKTSGGARTNTTREGKCVQKKACEAREVHIQLPKDILQKSKSEQQDIAEDLAIIFREKFGVDCLVGLHESKTKDNVHAHVLFPERLELPEPVIRRADRNVFLDANGIRKRTKKEILDEDGNLLLGCKIIPKGEIISVRYFSDKEDIFASKGWSYDLKEELCEWINERLQPDLKREVFDPEGPYLSQVHIGKGRPAKQAEKIREYNREVKAFNTLVREGIMDIQEAHEAKTAIMLSPNRLQALGSILAMQSGDAAATVNRMTAIGKLSNEDRNKLKHAQGGMRTYTGPAEEKKQQLRECFRMAKVNRELSKLATNDFAKKVYLAEARKYSSMIDRLKRELGYFKAEDYRRAIIRENEILRRQREWALNRRRKAHDYSHKIHNMYDYIRYLKQQRNKIPWLFATAYDKEQARLLDEKIMKAEEDLNCYYAWQYQAKQAYKTAKKEMRERKKQIRELKKEEKQQQKTAKAKVIQKER